MGMVPDGPQGLGGLRDGGSWYYLTVLSRCLSEDWLPSQFS
jgi:hypothetical protein